jgi:hypothetical protein
MSKLVPYKERFFDEDCITPLYIDPISYYNPYPNFKSETNQYDFEINQSNNDTNIELARTYERMNNENNQVEKIRLSTAALVEHIQANPGKPTANMITQDGERGIFRRRSILFEVHIW